MFEIRTYYDRYGNSPIDDMLLELDRKAKTDKNARIRLNAISRVMVLLEQNGTRIGYPTLRHIEDDIWELRPIRDRFFFAYWKDGVFILLHTFVKKTQKTPRREIEQAKRNLQDFLERSK
jgi:phage-related protein